MLAMGAITVGILLTLVVPMFTEVFQESGQDLPLPTQVLVDLSAFLKAWWWLMLPAAGLAIAISVRYLGSPQGRRFRGSVSLRLPEVRKVAAHRSA